MRSLTAAVLVPLLELLGGSLAQASHNGSTPLYKNPSSPINDRVADLLSRMTIEDKTAQLLQGDLQNWLNITTNGFNASGLADMSANKSGSFYVGSPIPQDWLAAGIRQGQQYLVENTTLGIPAFVQTEGIHGFLIGNATIFNSPIGQAASFNPDLVKKFARVVAQEAKALGVNQIFAPVQDLARELRHGRVEETFGEDAYLAGEMGHAYVTGLQENNVSAMVKHFAGFMVTEQGLNTGPAHYGERELRTTFLPSYRRAIIDGGAQAIMAAYHSLDGVPAVADYHLLTEILREEWGYTGFVMTDAGGSDRICDAFKMCQSEPIDSEAVTQYILPAGCDVEMGGGSFNYRSLPEMVSAGKLDISVVDTAVSRLLHAKFALGLFEDPYASHAVNNTFDVIHTPASVQLTRDLDAESIVLLENRNNTLPLSKHASIAVIGPMANYTNFGDYTVYRSQYNPQNVNPLAGITAASNGTVTFAQGCQRDSNDQSGFAEAIDTANSADVAVVIVGTWSRDQNELWEGLNATTGEHVDVADLSLVGAMGPLVQAIVETGKPTVVVFSSGKPVAEPWIFEHASAVVQQFYPGEQGGNALADVLLGDVNPSGKLPVGIPQSVGTLPIYYDYVNSGRASVEPGYIADNGTIVFGHAYVIGDPDPLYPFGYGMSYSSFNYSNVTLSQSEAGVSDVVTATVTVTNNSTMNGQEVVQLYVSDVIASVVVPNKELKGFKKVLVPAGQSVDVSIDVNVSKLGLWNLRMKYVVEPGEFKVMMGSDSSDGGLTSFAMLTVR
ncbi:hypothetical protein PMZ80_006189 [Knufia obscura]|uniref:beta-glucosidase n=2 Tax=Knufia TaxID=430999 RepID=A0AAN8I6P7_9EURO|nr:hypothetical protein PMZ80_006189 [Knufia obscura]KAK5954859.1 hypothetical protein OHC33_004585 [Knufia fluminis]